MLRAFFWTFYLVLVFGLISPVHFSQAEAAPFIWGKQDLEKTESVVGQERRVLVMENTVFIKPPFYSGPLPLKYHAKSIAVFGGPYSSTGNIPLEHKFPEWQTFFLYIKTESLLHCLPDGAITIDPGTRRIVAEAKILDIIKGSGVEIDEYHYGDEGNLIFQCTSVISFGGNFKTKENVKQGKKIKDYYFIFPVTGH